MHFLFKRHLGLLRPVDDIIVDPMSSCTSFHSINTIFQYVFHSFSEMSYVRSVQLFWDLRFFLDDFEMLIQYVSFYLFFSSFLFVFLFFNLICVFFDFICVVFLSICFFSFKIPSGIRDFMQIVGLWLKFIVEYRRLVFLKILLDV